MKFLLTILMMSSFAIAQVKTDNMKPELSTGGGNGGDLTEAQVVSTEVLANDVLKKIMTFFKNHPEVDELFPEFESSKLVELVGKVKIEVSGETLRDKNGAIRTALNFPTITRIIYNYDKVQDFKKYPEAFFVLNLHELLGLLGVEESSPDNEYLIDSYSISSRLAKFVEKVSSYDLVFKVEKLNGINPISTRLMTIVSPFESDTWRNLHNYNDLNVSLNRMDDVKEYEMDRCIGVIQPKLQERLDRIYPGLFKVYVRTTYMTYQGSDHKRITWGCTVNNIEILDDRYILKEVKYKVGNNKVDKEVVGLYKNNDIALVYTNYPFSQGWPNRTTISYFTPVLKSELPEDPTVPAKGRCRLSVDEIDFHNDSKGRAAKEYWREYLESIGHVLVDKEDADYSFKLNITKKRVPAITVKNNFKKSLDLIGADKQIKDSVKISSCSIGGLFSFIPVNKETIDDFVCDSYFEEEQREKIWNRKIKKLTKNLYCD